MAKGNLRRPVQVRFEPPFSQDDSRITGRFTCSRAGDDAVPVCEWIDDRRNRVWLTGQYVDVAASIEAWRKGRCGISYIFHRFVDRSAIVNPPCGSDR